MIFDVQGDEPQGWRRWTTRLKAMNHKVLKVERMEAPGLVSQLSANLRRIPREMVFICLHNQDHAKQSLIAWNLSWGFKKNSNGLDIFVLLFKFMHGTRKTDDNDIINSFSARWILFYFEFYTNKVTNNTRFMSISDNSIWITLYFELQEEFDHIISSKRLELHEL